MRRERPWLFLALVYPTFLSLVWFIWLAGTEGPWQKLAYGVGKTLQFLLPVLVIRAFDRSWPRPAWPRFEGLVAGAAFGFLVVGGMAFLYFLALKPAGLFSGTPALVLEKLQAFGLASPQGYLIFTLFVAVAHSLLEEYYWRWFVFGRLRRYFTFRWAVLLSSLGFMAHHVIVLAIYIPGYFWSLAVPLSLCIAVGGAVWAWLYERTGTIYAAWISHLIVDLGVFVLGYDILGGAEVFKE